ncbi:hypothetical protein CCACVL1_22149 [Corchorus capsularis]|uniref:Uncharacterized protein n=1 Tax=Corchorus capsularis TaxID=210143 RepID=A0A1R3H144_COCAP|nr:hypothetical protein CCACVL1_22149 [Corchorus capsularis]
MEFEPIPGPFFFFFEDILPTNFENRVRLLGPHKKPPPQRKANKSEPARAKPTMGLRPRLPWHVPTRKIRTNAPLKRSRFRVFLH